MPQTKRKLVPEDLYRFVLAADPQISPDGRLVAFVRTHVDEESREHRSQIWVVPVPGVSAPASEAPAGDGAPRPAPRPLTRGPRSDSQPRWSPDGKRLAFVRQIGEGPAADRQVWVLDLGGGEAWQLTTLRHGASGPLWSPDGRFIAFAAEAGEEEPEEALFRAKTEADRKEEERKSKDQARRITRFRYKYDTAGIYPDRWTQVWVVAVPETPPAGSAPGQLPRPVQVTSGPYNHQLLDWSPDGRWLAVACNREDERQLIQDVWLFAVPAAPADARKPIKLTDSTGIFGEAAWSPRGDRIALVGHHREFQNATLHRLWLYEVPAEAAHAPEPSQAAPPRRTCLSAGWDRGLGGTVGSDLRPSPSRASQLTWDPTGTGLYFLASDQGATHVFRVDLDGDTARSPEPLRVAGGPREVYGFSLDREGRRLAMAVSEVFNPGDLYLLDLSTGDQTRLTALNTELLAEVALPELEEVRFAGAGGLPIHGWILKPVGFKAGEKYPAVLQIHGGPHTCYGYSFYLEMQLQAAAGYAVIFTNPRGSTSYGQAFVHGCVGDYGGDDYRDLMAAVDHAVSLGYIDEERLAVTGGSYGGFMTNWVVGQTNRFAAAISHRSISNWISFWGVSDIGPNFTNQELGVDSLWAGLDKLWERSPLKHAAAVQTPLLLCHSENDLRCPMEQAEQFYAALKWLGKEVELLRHPRSNHELTRSGPPALRVDRFQHIERFLRQHVPVRSEQYVPLEAVAEAAG